LKALKTAAAFLTSIFLVCAEPGCNNGPQPSPEQKTNAPEVTVETPAPRVERKTHHIKGDTTLRVKAGEKVFVKGKPWTYTSYRNAEIIYKKGEFKTRELSQ